MFCTKHENVKSLQEVVQTDRRADEQTNDGKQAITNAQLISRLMCAKNKTRLPLNIKGTTVMDNFEFKVCLAFFQLLQNIQTALMGVVLCKSFRYSIVKEDVLLLEQTHRYMYQLIDWCLVFYVVSAIYQPHRYGEKHE